MNAIRKIARLGGKLLIPLFALLVLTALVVHETGMLDERFGPDHPLAAREASAAEAAATIGNAVAVERREIPVERIAQGTVVPRRVVTVTPRLLGAVVELTVVEGDAVEAGALLARIDDRDLRARLGAAIAAHDAARANVEAEKARRAGREAGRVRAAQELTRVTELLARDAATRWELEVAEAAASAASAEVEAADASIRSAESGVETGARQVEEIETVLDHTEVRAPQAGIVSALETELGELAAPGRALLTLYDPTDLRLEVAVPAAHGKHVAVGTPLRVEVPASDYAVEGTVESVDPRVDSASRTLRVKVALPAEAGLRAGQFGRARYETAVESRLVIPAAAVRRAGQVETVRVVGDDGRARARHVRTGRAVGEDRLEVLSGLIEGERVLTGEAR